jgi:hypothetical protein
MICSGRMIRRTKQDEGAEKRKKNINRRKGNMKRRNVRE